MRGGLPKLTPSQKWQRQDADLSRLTLGHTPLLHADGLSKDDFSRRDSFSSQVLLGRTISTLVVSYHQDGGQGYLPIPVTRPHSRLIESESKGGGVRHERFLKASQWFQNGQGWSSRVPETTWGERGWLLKSAASLSLCASLLSPRTAELRPEA